MELNPMLKGVHHVAYVVADMDQTVEMFDRLFNMKPFRREEIEQSGQEVALYALEGGATLEVIRPLHENTMWAEFLRKNGGDGIHHVAYKVEGINDRLLELKAKGISLINQQAVVSGVGWTVASIDPASADGLWFQLVQP